MTINLNTNHTSEWIGIQNVKEFSVQMMWAADGAPNSTFEIEVTLDKDISNLVTTIGSKTLDASGGNHLFINTQAKYGYYRIKYTANASVSGNLTYATL